MNWTIVVSSAMVSVALVASAAIFGLEREPGDVHPVLMIHPVSGLPAAYVSTSGGQLLYCVQAQCEFIIGEPTGEPLSTDDDRSAQ